MPCDLRVENQNGVKFKSYYSTQKTMDKAEKIRSHSVGYRKAFDDLSAAYQASFDEYNKGTRNITDYMETMVNVCEKQANLIEIQTDLLKMIVDK